MRTDLVLGSLAIAALVLAFLSTPIARFGEGYYSPADLTQNFTLTRVDEGHKPGNELLSDLAVQMQPWRAFAKSELAHGRLPLINPWNGGGVPHFANYQSAVFSPFSMPFYVLPTKAALIVAAFLKLFALGLFTFLFLREIDVGRAAAIGGAITFAFAGHNVLLVGYPHAAAVVALPAGAWFAERMLRRHELGDPREHRSSRLDVVGLAASLLAGLLAGHPETLFFSLLMLAVYVAWRLSSIARRERSLRGIVPLATRFAAAFVLALGLAAVQLVPFLEYLRESRMIAHRSAPQTPLLTEVWPLAFFPDLFGNPSTPYNVVNTVPPPDFETANLMYVGCVPLLLAAIALAASTRRRAAIFFGAVALVWICYAHDLLGIGRLAGHVPLLALAPLNRSQPIWIFCIAVLAAFGIERILRDEAKHRLTAAIAVLAAATVAYAGFRAGALSTLAGAHHYLRENPLRDQLLQHGPAHVNWIGAVFAVGATSAAALCVVRGRLARAASTLLLLASLFAPSGWLLRNYTPVSADRHFFPRTALVDELSAKVHRDTFGILGPDTLPPATNAVYELAMTTNYDALGIRRYDELYQDCFGARDNWRTWTRVESRGLELFGVERVLSKSPWLEIDTPFGGLPHNPRAFFALPELLPGMQLVQTFTGLHEQFEALQIPLATFERSNECTLDVELADARTGARIAHMRLDCRGLPVDERGIHGVTMLFPPVERSFGREFALRIWSEDSRAGNAVSVWRRADAPDWQNQALWRATARRNCTALPRDKREHAALAGWKLALDGAPLAGGLAFDVSASLQHFAHEDDIGPFGLYRFADGAPRYRLVAHAVLEPSEERARHRVLDPRFDLSSAVVVETPPDQTDAPNGDAMPGRLDVVSDAATRVRLKVELAHPAWLATARPWYPGWEARIDGRPAPVLRVNYAFLGVEIPAGARDVELEYSPSSVRTGAWISLLSAITLVASVLRRRALIA